MNCPRCGAENPETAEFCSLCMQRLRYPHDGELPGEFNEGVAGTRRGVSPAEWRPDVAATRLVRSGVVAEKIRKYRLSMTIYGALLLAVIVWLVLSFTVWGNPSPGKRASRLIDAINNHDGDAFASLFAAQERSSAESLFAEITEYMGTSGEFRNVSFRTEKKDEYTAYVHLQSGTLVLASGTAHEIAAEDGLGISFEKHGGKWVAKVQGTRLIP